MRGPPGRGPLFSRPGVGAASRAYCGARSCAADTTPLPPRRIALLKMQQLRVAFTPSAGAEAAAQAWLTRFDHHTQRGGG